MVGRLAAYAAYAFSLTLIGLGVIMMYSPSVEFEVVGVSTMLIGVTFLLTNIRISLNAFDF